MGLFSNFELILLIITIIALLTEFFDAAFGMGFGTALSSILIILGFQPYYVVPSMLLAQLIAGLTVSVSHILFRNIKLRKKKSNYVYKLIDAEKWRYVALFQAKYIEKMENNQKDKAKGKKGNKNGEEKMKSMINENKPETHSPLKNSIKNEIERDKDEIEKKVNNSPTVEVDESNIIREKTNSFLDKIKSLTKDSKTTLLLSLIAILGTILAALLSTSFSYSENFQLAIDIYISIMILSMGVITLALNNRTMEFSWKRILTLGIIAGFNKGISGGGFGPIMVSAQMVSGRKGKKAIAATLIAETVASVVGVIAYILTHILTSLRQTGIISWEFLKLAPYIIVGAVIAAPFAAFFTKKIKDTHIKKISGVIMTLLGVFMIIRLILFNLGIWEMIPDFVKNF
jgi:uncharacterized membrane protein YfcA